MQVERLQNLLHNTDLTPFKSSGKKGKKGRPKHVAGESLAQRAARTHLSAPRE